MGGRHIEDHSFWAGSKPKGTVFPEGPHKLKEEEDAKGFGKLSYYEDTTEALKAQQQLASKKVHSDPRKDLHRN